MATQTLLLLRTQARERADQVNSLFCSDAEVNRYLNKSIRDLADLLIDAVQDYYLSSSSFSVVASDNGIKALPADFYKARGLDDVTDSANPRTVRRFVWNERNDYNNHGYIAAPYDFSDVTYRIVGTDIFFEPPERAVKPYKLWYYPIKADLSADIDTYEFYNGWEDYVILDTAIKMMLKEESDASGLVAERQRITDRINALKMDRDQGLPDKISRIRNRRTRSAYTDDGGDMP